MSQVATCDLRQTTEITKCKTKTCNVEDVFDRNTEQIAERKTFKEPSCNNFCRVYRCNFESFYGVFSRRVSMENLYEIPKRTGVAKCRQADLASALGFNCSESNWCFKLSMCKVCNKDKKCPGIDVFNSITGFSDGDPTACSLQFSPTGFERF